jgi:hypothetical protein
VVVAVSIVVEVTATVDGDPVVSDVAASPGLQAAMARVAVNTISVFLALIVRFRILS